MSEHRQLPANIDAEESLIGCMLMSSSAVGRVIENNVSFGDFHDARLAILFDVIKDSYEASGTVDTILIKEALISKGQLEFVGDTRKLLELVAAVPSSLNVDHYIDLVLKFSSNRALIGASERITDIAYDREREVDDIIDEAESIIFKIAEKKTTDSMFDADVIVQEAFNQMDLVANKDVESGALTGFEDYDDLLLGLQKSSLYIIAARPAMGKTAFALNIATHVAETSDKPVLFFSLEMSNLELMNRIISTKTKTPFRKIQLADFTEDEMEKLKGCQKEIGGMKLFIDDDPNRTVLQMRAQARRLKQKYGELGAIFIDYIQLMNIPGKPENRQVAISELSRGLKILARELECPVVALSQLNRNLEYRADKRPMLADLRESGSLEQDADVVTFLYRDEIYSDDSTDRGICEVIIGKNRRGPTGTIKLAFVNNTVRFSTIPKYG